MAITKIDLNGGKAWVWDGEGTFLTQLTALTKMKVGDECIGPGLDIYGYSADGWTRTYTGGAASVSDVYERTEVFNEVVYSGTATGNNVTSGGIENYDNWVFQVEGVDADDDITIQASLDGTTYYKPDLVDQSGTAIAQDAANIEADGIYTFSSGPTGFAYLKVVRETATGSNEVVVTALAHPAKV